MPRYLPCGSRAFLVELDSLDEVVRLAAAVDTARGAGELPDILDVTPGARTLLVMCRNNSEAVQRTADHVGRLPLDAVAGSTGSPVELPVVYDGPDLQDVADELDIEVDEVIRRHTARPWTVAFTGFAPGFGYLAGGDPGLRVSRRPEPRTRVAPGSVGLAGEFSCVYPRESPGGWRLIGRTSVEMFDVARDEPALLRAGMSVTFVRTDP